MNTTLSLLETPLVPWPGDLLDTFGSLREHFDLNELMRKLSDRPADSYFSLIALSTVAFYRAEKGHNPKVNDIWDALVYCTTCCSVGYADIFAKTPVGKAVGSLLMTIGPAMAAKALDGRREFSAEEVQRKLLAALERIS